ncbi:MAG: Flp pilus assembly protein CpaB, partial [Alphaproteobacteria bacterium]
ILLLVALLAGGLAAYFFVATTNTPPEQVVVEGPTRIVEEQKARILVAKTQIGVGQRLSEATVEWQPWPELAVRAEYISDTSMPDALTQMDGTIARFEFFPGEPIMQQKLVHSDQGYLSAVLPQGMRAIPVQVSAASASGGYILPNDRVDVVLSHSGTSGSISETILENVKVLAIGTRLGEAGTTGSKADPEDPKAAVFADTIAVLELDPVQGETVINSTRLGTLSLVLRSIADYAQTTAPGERNNVNRPIRMIRFGRNQEISSPDAAAQVTDASFGEASVEGEGEGQQPATGQ